MMVGTIRAIMRFPVKSLLGENLLEAPVDSSGLRGDRACPARSVDRNDCKREVAKSLAEPAAAECAELAPRMMPTQSWFSDQSGNQIQIRDKAFEETLTEWLGRKVKLIDVRPAGIELNRARPDEVMLDGVDSLVTQDVLAIAAEAPNGGFFDFAPLHLMTSASLAAASAAAPDASIHAERYPPKPGGRKHHLRWCSLRTIGLDDSCALEAASASK